MPHDFDEEVFGVAQTGSRNLFGENETFTHIFYTYKKLPVSDSSPGNSVDSQTELIIRESLTSSLLYLELLKFLPLSPSLCPRLPSPPSFSLCV